VLACLAIAAGCATSKPKTAAVPKNIFFPPAPDAPRLQYLTAFDSEKDLRSGSHDSFMKFLTGKAPGIIPILKPYGGVAGRGNIYVCDTADSVILRLDLAAHKMSVIAPSGPAAFRMPLNMAVDTNGWIYVVDVVRDEVIVLDQNQNLVGTIGGKDVMKPRDVVVTGDRIYLTDLKNFCVHVLDKATRTNLFDIPRAEDMGNIERKLFQPINLAVDGAGRVFVSDFGAYRVQVFDADGKYVRSIGRYGDNYGEFARPKGVAVDRENRVYVADAAGQMVQIFDDAGHLLMWFGEPSASPIGLNLPAKVVLDYDDVDFFQKYAAPDFKVEHLVIVMNQYGTRKVSVFGFGHRK
jgi:DNA-binding beta-propeller fold protein YncE